MIGGTDAPAPYQLRGRAINVRRRSAQNNELTEDTSNEWLESTDLRSASHACRWTLLKVPVARISACRAMCSSAACDKTLYYLPITRIWPRISPPGERGSVCTFA